MNTTEMALVQLGAPGHIAVALETAMLSDGIVQALEKAHFAAQIGHESSGFVAKQENLNYSADRLGIVFKKYFPTKELRAEYAHNARRIGNRVYAGRYGNGSEISGDGYKYRGRGLIMLTFHDNYLEASLSLYGDNRLLINPDLALDDDVAAKIAVWFWNKKGCRPLALSDNIEAVTRKINGGLNGLEDRKEWLVRAKRAFNIT
jgi:Predicted chitinase